MISDRVFPSILDYNFTAKVEERFDDIAEGKLPWNAEIKGVCDGFHPDIDKAMNMRMEQCAGERMLGNDQKTGRPVFVKTPIWPTVQIGTGDEEVKPSPASLQKASRCAASLSKSNSKLFEFPRIFR